MSLTLTPVATVHNSRTTPVDDNWSAIISEITLADGIPDEALEGIEAFSHLEIIYSFNQVAADAIVYAGHPRGNKAWPLTGIFAQRKKDRPNTLGLCTVELLAHNGRTLTVKHLDAIDGTPVLDIKPVFKEFQPQGKLRQPGWVAQLMAQYWE